MKTTLGGFSHEKGLHCDTSALRDVFSYAGYSYPEQLYFGIGEGLGFYFRDGGNGKLPVAAGRTGLLEVDRRACERLGCSLKIAESSSPRRARERLEALLAEGKPVMLHADQYYLRYLRRPSHFGGYALVVTGLDEGAGTALVADHTRDRPVELPLAELAEARASAHRPFPPRHRWFEFELPAGLQVDGKLAMAAIGRNALEMLNSPVRNYGVGGIYYLANSLYRWEDKYASKELDEARKILHEAIVGPGTGGGCFRHLYGNFLAYAADELGLDQLRDAADGYHRAGAMWAQAGKLLSESICGCSSLSEAADLIQIIAAREHELQVSLLTTANLCCKRK